MSGARMLEAEQWAIRVLLETIDDIEADNGCRYFDEEIVDRLYKRLGVPKSFEHYAPEVQVLIDVLKQLKQTY